MRPFSFLLQCINILSIGELQVFHLNYFRIPLRHPGVRMVTTSSSSLANQPRAIGEFTEIRFCLKFCHRHPRCGKSVLRQNPDQSTANGRTKNNTPIVWHLVSINHLRRPTYLGFDIFNTPFTETPCCSRAAWYSAFFRSLCSRAFPIAAMISGRRTDFRNPALAQFFGTT